MAKRKKTRKARVIRCYENLPADAKAACRKFVAAIPGYSRERYVKDYDWKWAIRNGLTASVRI